jgi:hypothetical protein
MSVIRDYLQFQQSPYTVTDHAAEADAILEACHKQFPQLVPYLLEPSNLLALGGFRGVSPYVSFGKHAKLARSEAFHKLLHRFGIVLIEERAEYGKAAETKDYSYLLIHTGAFEAVREQYRTAESWWEPKPKAYDYLNYSAWYTYNLFECENDLENGKLPKQWLANWWTPHDICFGMLLGYPGTAICSHANAVMLQKQFGAPLKLQLIEFTYPNTDAPRVGYYVHEADKSSRQIAEHRKRWQAFFDMVYEAWPASRIS